MNITPHFTLEEFTASQTAARKDIDNTVPQELMGSATRICTLLEQVRVLLGQPILIDSGYRCEELNEDVGGAVDSQHKLAEAADIKCPAFGTPVEIARKIIASGLQFDQLIYEFQSWVHISVPDIGHSPRMQVLTIDHRGTQNGIVE